MQFLGIKWDNQLRTPWIRLLSNFSDLEEQCFLVINGMRLTISISGGRQCIGSFSHPSYQREPCTITNGVILEAAQCNYCRVKDSTYFLPVKALDTDRVALLREQPHLNYINIFGNCIIKTGVAAKNRKMTRQLEQGAIATIFFAEADGFISRLIESYISRTLSIKQAVSWNVKVGFIKDCPDKAKALSELSRVYDQIVLNMGTYQNKLITSPDFFYNYDYYSLSVPKAVSNVMLISEVSVDDLVSGKVIGVYGEIIFMQQDNGEIYALNTKSLLGYSLSISEESFVTKIRQSARIIELHKKHHKNLTLF